MKKLFGLLIIFALVVLAGVDALSGGAGIHLITAGGGSFAAVPLTLSTQKIVFLTSLKEEYNAIDTWVNKAEDLSSFVKDGQTLVFPEAGADPAVYKNRNIDIDAVEPTETTHSVELDVYDSQNYKIRNVLLHALPFEKVQYYTRKSADAIVKQEIADAAYAFAPGTEGNKRLVIPTTGGERNGYKMLTLDDIVTLARAADNAEFPDGRNLVLPSDMWWDLVNNNEILKGQLKNLQATGVINVTAVEYYNITIHKSNGTKLGLAWDMSDSEKAPQGSAYDADIVPAALFFCNNQVFRGGGMFEMFFKDKSQNTNGRAYEFGFQHRFKADFQMSAQRYSGLIYQPSTMSTPIIISTEAVGLELLRQGTNSIATVDTNKVTVTVQYPSEISNVLTDYLADALIETSGEIPAGTTVLIKLNGSAIGTATIATATDSIWLSQLIKLAAPTAAVRTSIAGHAGNTSAWELTITPEASYDAFVTVKTMISKNAVSFAAPINLSTTSCVLDITI